MGPLIVRADAGVRIGTGHVMRCLALAQAWQDAGGRVIFAVSQCAPALAERLRAEGIEVFGLSADPGTERDAAETAGLAAARSARWIVADGYHFDAGYQKAISAGGLNLLLIDDLGRAREFHAAAILNHNVYAASNLYEGKTAGADLLLGPPYALLRREFRRWHQWRREHAAVGRKVLVMMGGSDPQNVSHNVLSALELAGVDSLEVRVVAGSANEHYDDLSGFAPRASFNVEVMSKVADVASLMAWADAAVSAAGITSLELAFMQLPTIILTIADNQRLIAEHLGQQRMAVNLGDPRSLSLDTLADSITRLLLDRQARIEMASRGRVVDGEGASRVVKYLRRMALRLRRVGEDDRRMLWEWANDPEVRAVSFSSQRIDWEEHVQWLRKKLEDPRCFFYLALNAEDRPVGQIRFDTDSALATISVSLERESRRLGYGSRVIALASRQLFAEAPVRSIAAYVKPDNPASAAAFAKAGYVPAGDDDIGGQTARKFVLQRVDLEGLH